MHFFQFADCNIWCIFSLTSISFSLTFFFSFCCTSFYFSPLFAGWLDCWLSVWCVFAPTSPTWAGWQLQVSQAERRRSSSAIICGDPCHTHTRTHTPPCAHTRKRLDTHTHMHDHPACMPFTYKARYRVHTTYTHFTTHTHILCCNSLTRMGEQNLEAWQTDMSLSKPLHQRCMSDAGRRTPVPSYKQPDTHKFCKAYFILFCLVFLAPTLSSS